LSFVIVTQFVSAYGNRTTSTQSTPFVLDSTTL
jgi:hypothetical protein